MNKKKRQCIYCKKYNFKSLENTYNDINIGVGSCFGGASLYYFTVRRVAIYFSCVFLVFVKVTCLALVAT